MNSKQFKENIKESWITVRYFIPDNFSILKERISRAWAYAKFGYYNYDFDSGYLYSLMSFKLKRIKFCLENGIAVQEPENMQALDEAINICDRLHIELYEDKYYKELDVKWGEISFGSGDVFEFTRKKRVTKEDHSNYYKDIINASHQAENDRQADIDKLAKLLKTHAQHWWE